MGRTGVVLTNLGGPDSPWAIRPFLENLFSDPVILSIKPAFLRRLVARRIARTRAPGGPGGRRRGAAAPARRIPRRRAPPAPPHPPRRARAGLARAGRPRADAGGAAAGGGGAPGLLSWPRGFRRKKTPITACRTR